VAEQATVKFPSKFQETFIASLKFWGPERYEHPWQLALERILIGSGASALTTSFVEPSPHPDGCLFWRPLYREGDLAYVQNQMLFFNSEQSVFGRSAMEVNAARETCDFGRLEDFQMGHFGTEY
jgi:contact-dependent growth inhibition (CDI) system CdiI-like immunity protein